ncbi:hypothetical protein [Haladaptatus sp. W1]|uniref:hypothetical protein n=1 Tax=Haladaptatus sp. W1 TaxID=1897478 RepID=UPI0015866F77|nr:hypothetical protein [Haladaptatus sp. W1]
MSLPRRFEQVGIVVGSVSKSPSTVFGAWAVSLFVSALIARAKPHLRFRRSGT